MQKTILVIEDEIPLGEAIKLKLEKKGYRVIYTTQAEEGIRILQSENVDCIWLDIRLPGMDGIQFLELLRKNEVLKAKRVVVVSVSGTFDTKEEAEKLGVDDYIVKSEHTLDAIVTRVTEHV